ncbi:hypothetical protein FJY94_04125, partial [Candidatus Kaiserbacteria bacterium]|nr:hypothetical protein [Candidatus Kaiserbacteria bacterium]
SNYAPMRAWAQSSTTTAPLTDYAVVEFEYATSTPTCTTGVDPECNSSVLFLPGIEASRLYDTDNGETRLWEPGSDADAMQLAMTSSGTSVRQDIYTRDVLDEAYLPEVGPNVYKSFIADMNGLKAAGKIADWEAAPYDWRLSLDDILSHGELLGGNISYLTATDTPYIEQELRRLAAGSRTGKVTIVAHSNGGLVAKALMQRLGASTTAALVDKVILVASPQIGTPQAVGALLHGYEQGLPKDWLPFLLTPETARNMAQSMPGVYGLLPSFDYFTYVNDPVIEFDDSSLLAPWRTAYGDKIHSTERLAAFMTDAARPDLPVAETIKDPAVVNPVLLSDASAMHQAGIDQWSPPAGVHVIEVAGWGEDTLKTIRYYQGADGTCTLYRPDHTCAQITSTPVLDYKPILTVDGDGTVVAPSALWTTGSERYWVDLGSHNEWWINANIPRKHADVLEVDSLRTLIRHIVTNTSTGSLPDFITTSVARNENPEKHLTFTLHSPLSLDLYDNLGNHTGYSTMTGRIETNIPGSRFKVFGGVIYATAPASTTIQVIMRGLASGSFTLDVEETQGDTVTASTTFAGIPSSPATVVTITIPQDTGIASSTGLFVDENGDGAADMHLPAQEGGVATPDITPPEAVFSFSTTTNDVIVSSLDEDAAVNPSATLSTSTLAYTLADQSGNVTTLSFKRVAEKESKDERYGNVKASLLSIRYATLSTSTEHVLPKNEIQYEWERDKAGVLKKLEQKVAVKKDFTLRAKYDGKKNETKIYFVDKDNKEKLKEVREGLVLARIVTKDGGLEVEY